MPDWKAILSAARTVLVVDWPTREVPDTLALAGYEVVVHGGPGPEDYVAYEVVAGGAAGARAMVEGAGLAYLDEPDIVDAVRELA